MKRTNGAFLVAILILAAGCGPKANAPEDVAAIKANRAAYGQAATAGDTAALASCYSDDAVALDPNAPILVGKAAIQSAWRTFLDQYKSEEADVTEDVQIVGDLAIARGTYTGKSTPKVPGAAVIDDKGKWVAAYRRQPGGTWKIAVDTWNTDLPLTQALYPASADEQALLQIERDWSAAWENLDAAALEGILADGFLEVSKDRVWTKAQTIADMKAGIYKVESMKVGDMRAIVFGDEAIVKGVTTATYTKSGKNVSEKSRWTDIYEKQEGRWRVVLSHNVKVE